MKFYIEKRTSQCSSRYNCCLNEPYTVIKVSRFSEIYLGVQMPASYIGVKDPKSIVQDLVWNISRYFCKKKIPQRVGLDHASSCMGPQDYRTIYKNLNKKGSTMSADNLPNKSRNLSIYCTMECGSSEKFELLLEKCQLILLRKFFRNICCNIFMKQL